MKQKQILIVLILMSALAIPASAQGAEKSVFFTIGQDVSDLQGSAPMAFDLGLEMEWKGHIFGQFVYSFTPDYIKYGSRTHSYSYSLFAGYRFNLSKKLKMYGKAGIHRTAYQYEATEQHGGNFYYSDMDSLVSFALGGGFEYVISDKIDFLFGYEFKDDMASQTIFFGLKLKL